MTFFGGSSSNSSTTGRVQYSYLTAAQIAAATTGDPDVTYILSVAPYTRYHWNGTDMVPLLTTVDSSEQTTDTLTLVDGAKDRSSHKGQDGLLLITKSANWTVEAAYVQTPSLVTMSNSSSATVKIPTNTAAVCPVGSRFYILKAGTGDVVVAGDTGVTVLSPDSLTATVLNTMWECMKIGPNLWWAAHHVAATPAGTPPATTDPPDWSAGAFPTVTGDAVAGSTLTVSPGTHSGTSISYKWGLIDESNGSWWYIQPDATGTNQDTNSVYVGYKAFCDATIVNAYGTKTHRALGPTVTASSTPPDPPPAPATTRGPTTSVFTPSGNLTVTTYGEVISGKSFGGVGATNITVPAGLYAVIENCRFEGTGVNSIGITINGKATVRNCEFLSGERGIYCGYAVDTLITLNKFINVGSGDPNVGHPLTNNFGTNVQIVDNYFYNDATHKSPADVVSTYQSERTTLTYNDFDVWINDPSGQAFTIGDSDRAGGGSPGGNHYVAHNTVIQNGGGPGPGVFGSTGNTVFEFNCFSTGFTIMYYPPENPSPLIGVIVRKNVIKMSTSNLSAVSVVPPAEWATNIDSTNCALVPTS